MRERGVQCRGGQLEVDQGNTARPRNNDTRKNGIAQRACHGQPNNPRLHGNKKRERERARARERERESKSEREREGEGEGDREKEREKKRERENTI